MALAWSWSDVRGALTFSSQNHGQWSAVLWCVVCAWGCCVVWCVAWCVCGVLCWWVGGLLVGWWVGGLVGWWVGGLVGWWVGGLVDWWVGGLVGWWVGGLVGWWVGGLVGWWVGGLVGWWVGGLVGWWVGGVWCGAGVVGCGAVWCIFVSFCVVFLFFLSILFFLFLALSLSLFLSSLFFPLFSLLSSLPLFFHSSLLATKHNGKNRSTNTAANTEAFECDLAQGKCTAVGSLPPPLPSLLPSPPPLLKKKRGNFLLQEYFRRGSYFTLQFYFNSQKSPPGDITIITVLY